MSNFKKQIMVNQKLLEIIKCIKCQGGNLNISLKKDELICTDCNQTYSVHNQIPLLLQNKEDFNLVETEIHKKQGSVFNYVDHYQKDAIDFDYFPVSYTHLTLPTIYSV